MGADQEARPQALNAAKSAISGAVGEALAYLPANVQLQEIIASNGELVIIGCRTGE